MTIAAIPKEETERLQLLNDFCILETEPEEGFDRITRLASAIFDAPIALVSLVDKDRQWFKSRVGLDAEETSRDISFCAHAILDNQVLFVPDATKDPRFFDNPAVTEDPFVRTYVGAPLISRDNLKLGTLCVVYDEVTHVAKEKFSQLEALAQIVVNELELRLAVDEAKRAQIEAKKANEAKSSFLATMSHEIRTPMNGVMVMLDSLLKSTLDDKQHLMAKTALTSSKALLTIIDDILDLSKLEADAVNLDPTHFNLTELLEGIANLLAESANKKSIGLHIDIEADVPTHIFGDDMRIRQILFNLIGNAIKFTQQGSVTLRVSLKMLNQMAYVHFAVIDTGIGIPEEFQRTLFNRFQQADNSISRRYGGTGLGLAICEQLVELMSGSIGMTSALGKGSTFWFQVPLMESSREQLVVSSQKQEPNDIDISQLHILVVDDHDINREVAQLVLESKRATISTATNGIEAVDLSNKQSFDAILMDIQMPKMNGLEATRLIRRSTGPCHKTPIIALTANNMKGDQQEYLKAGMTDCIAKPFDPDELVIKIQQAVAAARPDNKKGL